ncbi:MAG: GNAT family N-acetyltransferase, partial [bacterium]
FQYHKREMTSVIALDAPFDFWPREARRARRRAEKRGVKIEESDNWENFYELLQQHMWQRHEVRPTHTLEELRHLSDLCPQRLRLFAAFVDQEMIADMLLFLCNRNVALAFYYVSHRDGFQNYHGFYSLVAEVLEWCVRQGFRYLDLGTYTIASEPNWGLANFKESFGALGVFRDTMSVEFGVG